MDQPAAIEPQHGAFLRRAATSIAPWSKADGPQNGIATGAIIAVVELGRGKVKEWDDQGEASSGFLKLEFAALLILHALVLAFLVAAIAAPAPASAHPGRTAADGCHNDRKNGGRHCHGGSKPSKPSKPQRASSGSVYYPNCTAARNAGAAPVRRGQPGYGPHLDRDNDGIGCE